MGTQILSAYIIALGGSTLYFEDTVYGAALPAPSSYWVMYSTYSVLLVSAQVVISKLFTNLLQQNIEREAQLLSAINAISDPLIIIDRSRQIVEMNLNAKRFKTELEGCFSVPLFQAPLHMKDGGDNELEVNLDTLCGLLRTSRENQSSRKPTTV